MVICICRFIQTSVSTYCFHHTSLHYNTHSPHTPFHNTHTHTSPHSQPTVQPNYLPSIFTLNSATGQLVVDGRGPGLDANGSIGTITVCVHTHDSLNNFTHYITYLWVILVGASLSKPHTSVTAFVDVVCMYVCMYVCLVAAIYRKF